ncbi:MAG TPA: hypothetical protein VIL09_18640 [Microvirga sp.]
MIHRPPLRPLLAGALLGALMAGLAGCGWYPRPIAGVPPGAPWIHLPVGRFLAEDRAEPEALALCPRPECGPPLAVGVVRLTGAEADLAEAVLARPDRLAEALAEGTLRPTRGRPPSKVRSTTSATRLTMGEARGFSLALSRLDGSRAAFGAALGRRLGDTLTIVLVIGEDPSVVERTARDVAAGHLAS